MSSYPPPPPASVAQRIEEAVELIEMEIRHAAAYFNAAVVPEVRRESISALRAISNTLGSLADRLDRTAAQQPPPGWDPQAQRPNPGAPPQPPPGRPQDS